MEIEDAGAAEIARRSRGTPRVANHLLRWVRDYAQVRAQNIITRSVADAALTMLDIDQDGLDEMDKRILDALINKFDGGPVGLNSIAVAVHEDASTLEDVHEPFLVMQGYLKRTPRGRVAMPGAYRKLGLPVPAGGQRELFESGIRPELFPFHFPLFPYPFPQGDAFQSRDFLLPPARRRLRVSAARAAAPPRHPFRPHLFLRRSLHARSRNAAPPPSSSSPCAA